MVFLCLPGTNPADRYSTVNFPDHTLESIARADFNERISPVGQHVDDSLGPPDRCCQLGNQVIFDLIRVSHRSCAYILVYRANRCTEGGTLNGFSKFSAGWLHQRRVKCSTDVQPECPLGSQLSQPCAGLVNTFNCTGDDQLTRPITIARVSW